MAAQSRAGATSEEWAPLLVRFNHITTQPSCVRPTISSPKMSNGNSPNLSIPNAFTPSKLVHGGAIAMSQSEPPRLRRGAPSPLYKQNSWSPDILRDEAWTNRRKNNRVRRTRSFTDDDLDELRACFELGFDFDSPDLDPKLSSTFPAIELYRAVNRSYSNCLSRSSSVSFSDSDSAASSVGNSDFIVSPGDDPELMKTKLRQWAQVVACSVRQSSPIRCDPDCCLGKKGCEKERENPTLHI